MYIRRTQSRNTMTGERYFTHRLVVSERVGDKVKQKTLLNLGRHFAIEQADWPLLCARIEELLGGQAPLVPVICEVAVEREAQRIVAQLLARQQTVPENTDKPVADVQSVDVESLEMLNPRAVGVEALGLWAMQQIDLMGLLESLGLNAHCVPLRWPRLLRQAQHKYRTHGRAGLRTRHVYLADAAQRLGRTAGRGCFDNASTSSARDSAQVFPPCP